MSASDSTTPEPTASDPSQIESDIEATRERLAGTVDELAVRLHPKEIGRRSVADVKERVRHATTAPDGSLRVERLAAVGAALAGLVALVMVRRHKRSS